MGKIEISKDYDKIRFKKKHWFLEEKELSESLGFVYRDGYIIADLQSTSKYALYKFMQYCFPNFVKTKELKKEREQIFKKLTEKYRSAYRQTDILLSSLPFYEKLYQHQKDAIYLMCHIRHNLLAYEMGLGKTLIVIAVSELLKFERTLIVCPAICKWNWVNELKMWGISDDEITVYDSKEKNIIIAPNERYIVINYDMLKKYLSILQKKSFQHLILDEATAIKNTRSLRHKYTALLIRSSKPKISFLTGTPVWNKPEDLFAYLRLSGHRLGRNYKDFVRRYTVYYENQWGVNIVKGKNLLELSAKISNFMIRKLKSECLNLPEKIYTKYFFDLVDYIKEYNKCIAKLSANGEQKNIDSSIHTLNILAAKSKIRHIAELAENIINDDKKVVIFTSYTEPRKMLEKHFEGRCVAIYGGLSSDVRQSLIEKFKNDVNCKVFIGNMIAAGTGINLYNASDVIFCNFPLTVSELMQCIDRLHRIGQVNTVNVYYTICKGSVDEAIYEMVIRKAEDIKQVIDGGKDTIQLKNIYSKLIEKAINKWNCSEVIS